MRRLINETNHFTKIYYLCKTLFIGLIKNKMKKVTLVNQTNVKKQIEKEILQISDKTIEENEIRGKIFLEKDKLIREIEMIKNMIKTSNQHRNEMEQTFLADIEMMKSQINHTNLPIIAPRTKSD